jgi:hypothetical protein
VLTQTNMANYIMMHAKERPQAIKYRSNHGWQPGK